jgi:hypothetical protein
MPKIELVSLAVKVMILSLYLEKSVVSGRSECKSCFCLQFAMNSIVASLHNSVWRFVRLGVVETVLLHNGRS